MTQGRMFEPKDVEILSHAISIHPNLEYACYATKLAKKHLKFPIMQWSGMYPLFSVRGIPTKIAKRKITRAHLRKFFPSELFPITNAGDFLGKTLAALSWGDSIHRHERVLANPVRFTPVAYRKES